MIQSYWLTEKQMKKRGKERHGTGREEDKETEKKRHTNWQKEMQTERQKERQENRQKERHTNWQKEGQIQKQMLAKDRHLGSERDKQVGRKNGEKEDDWETNR